MITEKVAQKYFGNENPMGKIFTINNRHKSEIVGIVKDLTHNSHFTFGIIGLYNPNENVDLSQEWEDITFGYTYIKVKENTNIKAFEDQIKHIADHYTSHEHIGLGIEQTYFLQPIRDIHLRSHLRREIQPSGNATAIRLLSAIAVHVLPIACLNFINLTTARSATRAKEVGLRKVMGAHPSQLVKQFLGESLMLCIIALVIALVMVEAALPFFIQLSGKPLEFSLSNMSVIFRLVTIVLFVGIGAGIYPALVLSSYHPVTTRRGRVVGRETQGAMLRKGFVICQFAASVVLIVGTLVVYQQLNFIKNKELGFDKEQMLVLPIDNRNSMLYLGQNYEAIKKELMTHHSIVSATATLDVPGKEINQIIPTSLVGGEQDKNKNMFYIFSDYDFLESYNITLAAGRGFQKEFTTDAESAYMINETAVEALGWISPEEAVGKRISGARGEGETLVL